MQPILDRRRAIVRVSRTAFVDMLLATAEAALVSPLLKARSFEHLDTYLDECRCYDGRGERPLPPSLIFSDTGLEVGGTLFGDVTGNTGKREILIERMVPESAAIRCDGYIERSPISARTVADLAQAAGAPFGHALGDFHSHPLLDASISDIEAAGLYAPSPADVVGETGSTGQVGLIMAISFSERRRSRTRPDLPPSTKHVAIAGFEVWLSAYRLDPNRVRALNAAMLLEITGVEQPQGAA